jgi:cytochrome c oxidase subunit 2
VVAGFKPIMPTFQGQVSEENLMALVAYVKSLAQTQQRAGAVDGSSTPNTSNVQ